MRLVENLEFKVAFSLRILTLDEGANATQEGADTTAAMIRLVTFIFDIVQIDAGGE